MRSQLPTDPYAERKSELLQIANILGLQWSGKAICGETIGFIVGLAPQK
jgi:hypothetical protein